MLSKILSKVKFNFNKKEICTQIQIFSAISWKVSIWFQWILGIQFQIRWLRSLSNKLQGHSCLRWLWIWFQWNLGYYYVSVNNNSIDAGGILSMVKVSSWLFLVFNLKTFFFFNFSKHIYREYIFNLEIFTTYNYTPANFVFFWGGGVVYIGITLLSVCPHPLKVQLLLDRLMKFNET